MVDRFWQERKAAFTMDSRVLGRDIFVKPIQLSNAFCPIEVTLSDIVKSLLSG